jgi:hypothetical protein
MRPRFCSSTAFGNLSVAKRSNLNPEKLPFLCLAVLTLRTQFTQCELSGGQSSEARLWVSEPIVPYQMLNSQRSAVTSQFPNDHLMTSNMPSTFLLQLWQKTQAQGWLSCSTMIVILLRTTIHPSYCLEGDSAESESGLQVKVTIVTVT